MTSTPTTTATLTATGCTVYETDGLRLAVGTEGLALSPVGGSWHEHVWALPRAVAVARRLRPGCPARRLLLAAIADECRARHAELL